MNKIIIHKGSFNLQEIELKSGTITIGRAADNDVQLRDKAISSHHAKIVTVLNTTYIQDLGSTNGITVNGQRVETYALSADDVIKIGNHEILFRSKIASKFVRDVVEERTMLLSAVGQSHPTTSGPLATKSDVTKPVVDAAKKNNSEASDAPEVPARKSNIVKLRVVVDNVNPQTVSNQTKDDLQTNALEETHTQPEVVVRKPDPRLPEPTQPEALRKVIIDESCYIDERFGDAKQYQKKLSRNEVMQQIILNDTTARKTGKLNSWLSLAGIAVFIALNLAVYYKIF